MLRRIETFSLLMMITHVVIGCCAVVRILLSLTGRIISNLATTLMSACLETEKGGVAAKFYACNLEIYFPR